MNDNYIVMNEMEFHNKYFLNDKKVGFKIKDMLIDNWDNFVNDNPNINIRDVVFREVDRVISCRTSALGYSFFECPDCGKSKCVYHTCKSRFCSSCGNKTNIKRVNKTLAKCYKCNHRHIVFTISDYLWDLFREDRNLIDLLFKAVSITILSWFKDKSKKKNLIPGIIAILHTYGRDLKWNPHIHTVVTEGAMSDIDVFTKMDFISYDALRKRFQKVLLDLLTEKLGKDNFKHLKNKIYLKSDKGFYVYAKKDKQNRTTKDKLDYALRYSNKPAMAESRILDYDGQFVTFWYKRHEDNLIVVEKIHVYDFFKRIIIHIPNPNFKTVRYYGIYAKKHKFHDKMFMLVSNTYLTIRNQLSNWRMLILHDFDTDPLSCPFCGNLLIWQFRVT
jgi:hypothetical protein